MDEYNAFNGWKCLLYRENFEAILKDKFLPPVTLHIYPTNRCNANCSFCIMKEEKTTYNTELNKTTFESIIASANNMGIKSIHISGGGEPTLYNHLDRVNEFKGLKVLSTNGAKLSTSIAKNFDRIRVSLNAGTSELHQQIMGTKNWNKIWHNISKIKNTTSCEIGIGFVLDDSNWKSIPSLIKKANETRVDFVHIRPAYYPRGSDGESLVHNIIRLANEDINECKENSTTKIYSMSDKFDGYWSDRKYDKCLASPLHAVVAATGNMIICQDVFKRFGDLNKQKLEDVWGSKEHKEAIKSIDVDSCPRCVMNKPNEIMENVFIKNKLLKELI